MLLQRAILQTLAYSDLFDHPLTVDELHGFLTTASSRDDIQRSLVLMHEVSLKDGYYYLTGRDEIVELRKIREAASGKEFERARLYGRILGHLPFIRMVALTGSLAMLNLSKNRDMDFMLVTKPGRVWMARAFALLFGRLVRLFGDVICPNVIISENALEWEVRNLYTAREFAQMVPVSGMDIFHGLREANIWVKDILPNANMDSLPLASRRSNSRQSMLRTKIQSLLELPLKGKLGDLFESWEMSRKIARFSKQRGYGLETNFSADVCQGNFDHHGSWAMKAYEERLNSLSALTAVFASQVEDEVKA